MIGVDNRWETAAKDAPQFELPVDESFMSEVLSIPEQEIKRDETWLSTVEEQVIELRMAALIKADDLTVQHYTARHQSVTNPTG